MDTKTQKSDRKAFVFRIAPSGKDIVPQALEENDLIIGWSEAFGLLDEHLSREAMREIVRQYCYPKDNDYRRAGIATGYLWLFIKEMNPGDMVVVPHRSGFYVGEVAGPARYQPEEVFSDTAYRRSVKWLNNEQPIQRKFARAALQSRMKFQGTCVLATDLSEEIIDALNATTSFGEDLHKLLIEQTIKEIRAGKMDGAGFEQFIASLMKKLGGDDVRVIPHAQDKGADVIARFRVAGTIQLTVAIQAKHYKPKPPVSKKVVESLLQGMEAESADIGMVITSGTISEEAYDYVRVLYEEEKIKIELIDGEQLGALILEHGVTKT